MFSVERLYRHVIVRRVKVGVKCAGRYDSVSRTAIVELEKPMYLDYEPGQYIMLNLPKIGECDMGLEQHALVCEIKPLSVVVSYCCYYYYIEF